MTFSLLSFTFQQILPALKLTQLHDNITAMAAGEDNAPRFTYSSLSSQYIQSVGSSGAYSYHLGQIICQGGNVASVPSNSSVDVNLKETYTTSHFTVFANNSESTAADPVIFGHRLSLSQVRLYNAHASTAYNASYKSEGY